MKILKPGKKPDKRTYLYKIGCTHCSCIFLIRPDEIISQERCIDGLATTKCPHCGQEVSFKPITCWQYAQEELVAEANPTELRAEWVEASSKPTVHVGKKCSNCGARIKYAEERTHLYCHNCGAKMYDHKLTVEEYLDNKFN